MYCLLSTVCRFVHHEPDAIDSAAARVVPEWAERVGEGIANVTRPIRVSDGVLLVAVRSSAWLMELRMMERQILRTLNGDARRGRIDGIRFVMDESTDSRQ